MSVPTAYEGELMLAGWTESHTSGAKVSFWLPDTGALDAFRHMTARKGNTAGQRFMAVLVLLGDGEEAVPVEQDKPAEKLATAGRLAMDAGVICRTAGFQAYVADLTSLPASQASEQSAADLVRAYCRVQSRRELDTSPTAAQLFHRLMASFNDWRRRQVQS